MEEEEIEMKDVKGEHSDIGAEDPDEESSLLENRMEHGHGKDGWLAGCQDQHQDQDAGCQDQDMPMWRLPRWLMPVSFQM